MQSLNENQQKKYFISASREAKIIPGNARGGEARMRDLNLEDECNYDIEFAGEDLH